MIDGDWVKLHRKILDSRVFSDPKALKVWVWCLCKAGYRDRWFDNTEIPAGSFVTGRKSGSAETHLDESSFYRAMQRLDSWGMIAQKSNNRWTLVSICNWQLYQDAVEAERTTDEQRMNNQRTTDEQPVNTREESKESKEGKEHTKTGRKRPSVFVKPTLEEVTAYCRERGNDIDPEEFLDYYQARAWKFRSGQPMKDWKATVRTWEKRDKEKAEAAPLFKTQPIDRCVDITIRGSR